MVLIQENEALVIEKVVGDSIYHLSVCLSLCPSNLPSIHPSIIFETGSHCVALVCLEFAI